MKRNIDIQFPEIPLWLVWGIVCYFVSFKLGSYPILDNNEGLYAEIPREMLRSGDWRQWIIPHLNGLPYMEKPPLLYWLTALCFAVFGESEWVARLVPVFSSVGCVCLILWFTKTIERKNAGGLAALIFISSLGVTAMSRTLMFDMLLTVLLTAAVMSGYLFCVRKQRRFLYICMAMLALALLAKGFVALILFSAVMGAYLSVSSTSPGNFLSRVFECLHWRGLLVFLLIAAPWHIAAMMVEPIFPWFYFINEHILRFLGKREPHDYYAGAWWYCIPRVLLFLFPWSFFLPVLAFARADGVRQRAIHLFLCLAWLMPLVFFSVSSAKANYYLVIVMPFAAIQMALMLEEVKFGGKWGLIMPGVLLSILFLALNLWLLGVKNEALNGLFVKGIFTRYVAEILLAASVLVTFFSYRVRKWGLLLYILIPMLCLPVILQVADVRKNYVSTKEVAAWLRKDFPHSEVVLYRVFEHQSSLPFYLKTPVRIVDSRSSDLFWGNKLHKNNIVVSDVQFQAQLENQKVALLVLKEDLPDFRQKKYFPEFKLTRESGNTLIFTN